MKNDRPCIHFEANPDNTDRGECGAVIPKWAGDAGFGRGVRLDYCQDCPAYDDGRVDRAVGKLLADLRRVKVALTKAGQLDLVIDLIEDEDGIEKAKEAKNGKGKD